MELGFHHWWVVDGPSVSHGFMYLCVSTICSNSGNHSSDAGELEVVHMVYCVVSEGVWIASGVSYFASLETSCGSGCSVIVIGCHFEVEEVSSELSVTCECEPGVDDCWICDMCDLSAVSHEC